MNKRAHQAQAEWNAGYRSGFAGEPRPRNEKGQSFYGGWLAGKADRDDNNKEETQ